jgi:hypothetical protein
MRILFLIVVCFSGLLQAQTQPVLHRVLSNDSIPGQYKVTIHIETNGKMESFAKYTDFLPEGAKFVRSDKLGTSVLKVEGSNVKFIWTDYPKEGLVEVIYIISFPSNHIPIYEGQFKYLMNNTKQEVSLNASDVH